MISKPSTDPLQRLQEWIAFSKYMGSCGAPKDAMQHYLDVASQLANNLPPSTLEAQG